MLYVKKNTMITEKEYRVPISHTYDKMNDYDSERAIKEWSKAFGEERPSHRCLTQKIEWGLSHDMT